MHRLLPLLLLACAGSKPAEYHRGTYRPAPPTFQPSQDAPHTVGLPGHLQAKMFQTCAVAFAELDDGANKQGVPVLHAKRLRAALETAAENFLRNACGGVQLSTSDRRVLDRLSAALRHTLDQPE